jgi:hypothetical protein
VFDSSLDDDMTLETERVENFLPQHKSKDDTVSTVDNSNKLDGSSPTERNNQSSSFLENSNHLSSGKRAKSKAARKPEEKEAIVEKELILLN